MHVHFSTLFGISVRQLRITPSKIIWTHCEQQKSQPLFWRRNYEDDCDCCTSVWIYGIAVGRNLKDHKKEGRKGVLRCAGLSHRAVDKGLLKGLRYLLIFKFWNWVLAYFNPKMYNIFESCNPVAQSASGKRQWVTVSLCVRSVVGWFIVYSFGILSLSCNQYSQIICWRGWDDNACLGARGLA